METIRNSFLQGLLKYLKRTSLLSFPSILTTCNFRLETPPICSPSRIDKNTTHENPTSKPFVIDLQAVRLPLLREPEIIIIIMARGMSAHCQPPIPRPGQLLAISACPSQFHCRYPSTSSSKYRISSVGVSGWAPDLLPQ